MASGLNYSYENFISFRFTVRRDHCAVGDDAWLLEGGGKGALA